MDKFSKRKSNKSTRIMTLFEWLATNSPNSTNSTNAGLNTVIIQLATACKTVSGHVKRASFEHLYGDAEMTNFHGEVVQKLDMVSNHTFIDTLIRNPNIHSLISEEGFDIMDINESGEYCVAFDPLDGSSNINANVNVGSIFGIYRTKYDQTKIADSMVAAGYALYGSSTIFVIAIDGKPQGFSFDELSGELLLTHPDITTPNMTKIYSCNEGNFHDWNEQTQQFVDDIKKKKFSLRYIGSMVGDVHRTLLYGGIFMYPASKSAPEGKLRLLYEVAPMSYLIEKAGGKAMLGNKDKEKVIDTIPKSIHQRVPVYLGDSGCVDLLNNYFI